MHTRPLTRKDIPQIANIAYDAFSEDELYNWLHPGLKQYHEDYRRSQINSLRARLVRPGCHGFVVVSDDDVDELMGYAFFTRTTKNGGVSDEGAKIWMQDTWFNKLERTLLSLTNTYASHQLTPLPELERTLLSLTNTYASHLPHPQNRAISPKNLSTYLTARSHSTSLYAPLAPYWHVSVLAIAPKFQRRGVGALLVQEGQRLASEDCGVVGEGGRKGKGVPMVLESSPAARRLYEKGGFEVFWEGRIGGLEDVCMVWYPEGFVQGKRKGDEGVL